MPRQRAYNGPYRGEYLNRVAFPMGGIGAGMICLDGSGSLSHVSLRNRPSVFNEPYAYAAICIEGEPNLARVLEGPVPRTRAFGFPGAGNGGQRRTYGLPRFAFASFRARFPFGIVTLKDRRIPLRVQIVGWSPFIPGDSDNSSLPVAALEYRFSNAGAGPVEAVFSFNALNMVAIGQEGASVAAAEGGFIFRQAAGPQKPWERADLCVMTDAEGVAVNCAWFRGRAVDVQMLAWKNVEEGRVVQAAPYVEGRPSPGASLYVPFRLEPGQKRTIRLLFCWYVPMSDIRVGKDPQSEAASTAGCACGETAKQPLPAYVPWYAGRFTDIESVARYWRDSYEELRRRTLRFSDCFYDSTLPPEVIEAVAANLAILKSPTCLRQTDGRFWGWEGCNDEGGCCHGSCTHVWNYAQALAHLFADLERSLRWTEFHECQDERGHQTFRAPLPIRPASHDFHAAADGQLGGIMKVYRDWRISGDLEWLRALWPRVKASLNYCIETWDPDHMGVPREPHHNTYDIEFWGPEAMCAGFYLGALQAAVLMGRALGDEQPLYAQLLPRGRSFMERELFNGEYFIQRIEWRNLRARNPVEDPAFRERCSPEALALISQEGPPYQIGPGCLTDGVLGAWMAACCGLPEFLDRDKVVSHLRSVHRYNFRSDLSDHANSYRSTYAFGKESGLVLCTWPKGGRPTLPMYYCDEVWTGCEYQVASHLIMHGFVQEGLEIVRATRSRYDGRVRNPFDEYECGHWYARALSSYALLQALTGARYDAVEKTLYVQPRIPGDFRSFLCTAHGYGTVGVKDGKPFFEPREGTIEIGRIEYTPCDPP